MNPITFIQHVRDELLRVTWPTRAQTIEMTLFVLVLSAIVGVYIGGLDSLFTSIFDYIIKR
ncbi:MAG TPA: preprotein translocase subunit SecE [Candidatus Pacebacteria bacterium]|nr:preprotein translocase subunit SecE [Candidatus Paceibacterota bacterium]HAX01344.1 preprotein translocase subunit SecE [Candidatus Paceibacterota bacterium]